MTTKTVTLNPYGQAWVYQDPGQNVDWSNPQNAMTPDGQYATMTIYDAGSVSYSLRLVFPPANLGPTQTYLGLAFVWQTSIQAEGGYIRATTGIFESNPQLAVTQAIQSNPYGFGFGPGETDGLHTYQWGGLGFDWSSMIYLGGGITLDKNLVNSGNMAISTIIQGQPNLNAIAFGVDVVQAVIWYDDPAPPATEGTDGISWCEA